MYGLLGWILIGLGAGTIARFVVKGPHNFGCISTIVLGVLGSLVGGTLANVLGGNGLELQPSGFLGAAFGAILVLAAAKIFTNSNP